jgi:hypothetical protein
LSSSETGNKIYSFFIGYLRGIFPLRQCTKPTVVDYVPGDSTEILQNNNEVSEEFHMFGFNRFEWKGTDGYNTKKSLWDFNSEHDIHIFE